MEMMVKFTLEVGTRTCVSPTPNSVELNLRKGTQDPSKLSSAEDRQEVYTTYNLFPVFRSPGGLPRGDRKQT